MKALSTRCYSLCQLRNGSNLYRLFYGASNARSGQAGIEIMAALPTVILGFLGGLWLAPIIEANLSSVLSVFVFLPLLLFAFALPGRCYPKKSYTQHRVVRIDRYPLISVAYI